MEYAGCAIIGTRGEQWIRLMKCYGPDVLRVIPVFQNQMDIKIGREIQPVKDEITNI